jgi:sulfur-carrier protein adenylyltransferase/sulfurtransferase
MNREKYSVLLVAFGIILAVLPLRQSRTLAGDPATVLRESLGENRVISADQVAKAIADEDQGIRLIDLRTGVEFMKSSIPGAVNIPYSQIPETDPTGYLGSGVVKNVFCSDSDIEPGYAVVMAFGLGYRNCYILRGGIKGFVNTVADTVFSGEKISARENALFESRLKAGRLFREMNSLPDSLKVKYLNSKKFNPKKLDGGCE